MKREVKGFKLFITSRNVTKLLNLALIEKNYIFGVEVRPPLALQAANKQFSLKQRETFKNQVHTLSVLFENLHVSQTMLNQCNVHIMNHFMQCFVI